MVFGLHVANTVGTGIVSPTVIFGQVIFGALMGTIIWNVVTWLAGISSSCSHAQIGGLMARASARRAGRRWQVLTFAGSACWDVDG